MNDSLKNQVMNKIHEMYPCIEKDEIFILFGSRAKGYALKDSDIDTMIFTA